MSIRCVIIDDEPSSQDVLKKFVGMLAYLDIVAVCNNAFEALEVLNSEVVDLLFLDIHMPQLSGIDFYKTLETPPLVIFTTAYSEYAVKGFEVNAVDYLLKPFSYARFLKAITKVSALTQKPKEYIFIKSAKKIHQLKCDEIKYIESNGDYALVYVNDDKLTVHLTLIKLKLLLRNNSFIQVHRSFLINTKHIQFVEGNRVVMNNSIIPIGQKYKSTFIEYFQNL